MPSGPVYQPTTVSYESPGLLSQTSSVSPMKVLKKPLPQAALLLFSLILIAAGVALLASGAADYANNEEHKEELALATVETCEGIDIGVVIAGFFLTIIGFSLIGLYIKIKVGDWRHNCVCPFYFSRKQSIARKLQGNSGGQILALNPSTDPLVTHTQYAPVSELPPRPDEEERRNLMPDSKDCLSSAEESDRMLDPDPRIVLRPIGRLEEA